MNKIVFVLTHTVLAEFLRREIKDQDGLDEVAGMLCRKMGMMPFILRHGLSLLTFVFNGWGILAAGRPFVLQNSDERQRQMQQWKTSPLGPCRALIGFYEKMVVFIYLSLCQKKT